MRRGLLGVAAAAAGLAFASPANRLYWPVPTTNVRVCAYRDNAGKDWRCGTNRYSGHKGTDIAVGVGTSVLAALGGRVVARNDGCPYGSLGSTCGGGAGNYVILSHSGDNTLYMYLTAGSNIVASGATVACGDRLGGSGSSGNSSGPHLHFEVRVGAGSAPWGGTSDDPWAGACSGPVSFWVDQGSGYSSSCSVAATSPKAATTCGCPAGVSGIWTCNAAGTARTRCVNGQVETQSCPHGCEVRSAGTDDVCRPPPACPEGLDGTWRCTADGAQRRRCEAGVVQTESCEHGCEGGAGQAGTCRAYPACPAHLGPAWSCSADGTSRERCERGVIETEACPTGCGLLDGAEAVCLPGAEPVALGCSEGTYEAWTCTLDGQALERCVDGVLQRRACGLGCFEAGPEAEDSCAPPPGDSVGPVLEPVLGGCHTAPGPWGLALGLALLRARRRGE
jgi:hypothetical protein